MGTMTTQPVSAENIGHITEHYYDRMLSSYFYLSSLHGYSRSEMETMVADQSSHQYIVRTSSGKTLISLHDINQVQGHARIQLCADQAGSADIGPFLREYMRRSRLGRLYSYVFREEHVELALLKAAQFQQEAVFRQHVFMNGAYRDILVYGWIGEQP